jgi:hypothetical protein
VQSLDRLIWVSLPRATFGIIIRDRKVVDGAPYARARGLRLVGMDERAAAEKLRRMGAKIMPLPQRCDCHEWRSLTEIGGWQQAGVLVRDWALRPEIWEPRRHDLSRDELRIRIAAAGGISCEYALEAFIAPDGHIELVKGVHRWTVAAELGIGVLPVKLDDERESSSCWSLDG